MWMSTSLSLGPFVRLLVCLLKRVLLLSPVTGRIVAAPIQPVSRVFSPLGKTSSVKFMLLNPLINISGMDEATLFKFGKWIDYFKLPSIFFWNG